MRPLNTRFALLAVALVGSTTACSPDPQVEAADLAGTYVYHGEGSVGPLAVSWTSELELHRTGTYQLDVRGGTPGEQDHDVSTGEFEVRGDRLFLYDDEADHEQQFRIAGDSLVAEYGIPARLLTRAFGLPAPVLVRAADRDLGT